MPISIDQNVVPVFELRLVAGNNFNSDPTSNNNSILINEKAVQSFNLRSPNLAIGKLITIHDSVKLKVVGVLRDFHYENFKSEIGSVILEFDPSKTKVINSQLNSTNDYGKFNEHLNKVSHELGLGNSLVSNLFENEFSEQQSYSSDINMLGFFATMFLIITCLGLLGIVSYSTEQRMKEMTIRKILGAKNSAVFFLLSKDYLKIILIAVLIGLPIGFISSLNFLRSYVYKISIGWETLCIGLGVILIIGAVIIISQTVKVAFSKPVSRIE